MTSSCPHSIQRTPPYDIWHADRRTRLYKNERLRYAALSKMLPTGLSTIVDVGCGTGFMSVLLARRKFAVTAVDANLESLAAFESEARKWNIRVHHADLFIFRMEPADALICQEVLEHIPDFRAALRKISEFLKPGGVGLFCVPYRENLDAKKVRCLKCGESLHRNGHLHSFSEPDFRESLEASGYRVLQLRRIVNKRVVKWIAATRLPVNAAVLGMDTLMNHLFPAKSTFIASLVEKPFNQDGNIGFSPSSNV